LQIYNFAITDVSPHDLIKPKPHKNSSFKSLVNCYSILFLDGKSTICL